jgi:D-3-phosphoglycerate dehydrogenase / 2-oxoglutarate reductase
VSATSSVGPELKALVTDFRFLNLDIERELLGPRGIRVEMATSPSEETLVVEAADADVLLVQRARVPASVIEAMRHGKGIVRYGAGMDSVDLEAARARGIEVAGVLDYGTAQVASHALALILAGVRRLPLLDHIVRTGGWDFSASRPIFHFHEQTVGLLGFGRIGRATARMLGSLGFGVLVHDPFVAPEAVRSEGFDVAESVLDVLQRSDVVSLHMPLTPDTHHVIGRSELAAMRPHAWLVNVSRGKLVDQEALTVALAEGVIGGAAIDVYEHEPPSADDPLFALPNVMVTPHIAWYSEQSERDLRTQACNHVLRILGR